MIVLTADQMRHADALTIERGMPGLDLMHNAGAEVCDIIIEDGHCIPGGEIVIIAGRGNNGGDGFHVAELLASQGCMVNVFIAGLMVDVTGDAATCLAALVAKGITPIEITGGDGLQLLADALDIADLAVDALFGTGLVGDVRGIAADIIDALNVADVPVLSIDLPSGVDATTGACSSPVVAADFTVTFGALKAGHILPPGSRMCGDVEVADIGLDDDALVSGGVFANALADVEASAYMPVRAFDAHKGSVGRVLVVAGSVGMTGAAVLTSNAVLRAGAGVVTLGCPESLNDVLEMKLTEVMTLPLAEVQKKRCLSRRALGMIREKAAHADIVALGPGLGRNAETMELVRRFAEGFTGRLVLDADGIFAFKGMPERLHESPADIVLTPHTGELAALLGVDADMVLSDRFAAAKSAAAATGKIVLLKGAPSILACPSGTVWINPTGNEGMATAGMGDVLTGVITGLAAQGLDLLDAAVLGAWLHGRAGDMARDDQGVLGMVAGDVLDRLPDVLMDCEN